MEGRKEEGRKERRKERKKKKEEREREREGDAAAADERSIVSSAFQPQIS